MSTEPKQLNIEAWWQEFERELAKMTIPCVPMPAPILEKSSRMPRLVKGNTYYTLANDKQFAVDSNYPNSVGWNYE